ncbi:MAG: hypothetical protein DCC75_12400 [Proteobacteria bacterium]|nr:MAG: hypothetical protein DCC75_12400 [Pseudomonadota bacterium]
MANKFIFHATGVTEGVNFPAGLGRRYFLISQQEIWLSILAVFLLLLIILRKPWAAPKAVA